MSRLFHPASARVVMSLSFPVLFCFVFKEGDFKVWQCASCPAGVTAAVLCGGGLLPVAMVIKDLPSRGSSIAPALCLPWESAAAAEMSFPAGELGCL